MRARVNGEDTDLEEAMTIASLVVRLVGTENQRGVAVARNGEVVPRREWDVRLDEDDEIEIVRAVQGG